jgi:O-antigen/teichoic acid export membrane protein
MEISVLRRLLQAVSIHAPHIVNVVSFIATRLIAIAAFALSVPFFIRHTSEAQYGVVAIGFSLLGLSSLLDVAIGYVITQSVGRGLARSSSINHKLLHGLFSVYVYAAVLVAVLLAIIILFLPLNYSYQPGIFITWNGRERGSCRYFSGTK